MKQIRENTEAKKKRSEYPFPSLQQKPKTKNKTTTTTYNNPKLQLSLKQTQPTVDSSQKHTKTTNTFLDTNTYRKTD